MTITELAIKRPTFIIVVFLVLTLLGVFGYFQLKYELYPNIEPPVVVVITAYPGAAANEVESSVTKKIEDAVCTLDKVDAIHATSQEGVSSVVIEFNQDANLNFALQDAQRKVNLVVASLPDGVKPPTLMKFSMNEFPVFRLGASSSLSDKEFYQLVKDRIQPELSRIAGVGQVTLTGGAEREIKIYVDANKMQAYGISILQVIQSVKSANLDIPTGKIDDKDRQYVVRLAGNLGSLNALKQLIIGRSKQGGNIELMDVANVVDSVKETTSINRVNGQTSLGISITKQTDANSVEVSKLVHQTLKRLTASYAKINLKINIAQDNSEYTTASANAVKEDLMIAILLVALVMLVFLHSLRNSIIVMVAIPASLVSTMIGIWAFGFTLNMISLLALSLVIGILVDDSIVVLENIHRHLEQGKDQRTAALDGRNEIGFTALSITLVDVAVFLPLGLVTGMIGGMMREFALVIVTATLMSLLVSFTITPMLASRFSKVEHLSKNSLMGRFGIWFEKQYQSFTKDYLYVLKWGLTHRWAVLLIALVLFFASCLLLVKGFIGTEFAPTGNDRGQYTVSLELPLGSKIEQTNAVAKQIEAYLSKLPETSKVITTVGGSSNLFSIGASSSNTAEINVDTIPINKRTKTVDEIVQEVKVEMAKIPGIKSSVGIVSSMGGYSAPIQLMVTGTNLDDVMRSANTVKKVVQQIPGTADVKLSSENGKPERRINIDRVKMAAFGLTLADVGAVLRMDLAGDNTSTFRDRDGNEYSTLIILDQADRSKTDAIGNLTITNRLGQPVALKQFADFYHTLGPTKLQRENRDYAITVSSQAIGRTSGSIAQEINATMKKHPLPPGINLIFSGTIKSMNSSFMGLAIALLAAIIFVYLIMAALYNSFIYPFIVLFSVPLAIIGALLALALTMNSLNIFTILGIIMQIGLVSKNAILLVDFTNKMREEGYETREALLEAGKERLRPILMTTLTMIFGMLPIALANAAGSSMKNGLGWALIGGLTCSMLMTLVVVPVVYIKVDQTQQWMLRFRKKMFGGEM
jgi:hydrophobic/amphiphilic exporter-1 (mainly G- bacteria), HAE1 family